MDPETGQQEGPPNAPANPQTNNDLSALQAELDQTKAELARLQIESESELNASNARFIELESKLNDQNDQRSQLEQSLQEIQRLKHSLESRLESDQNLNQQLQTLQSEKADLLQVIRDKENEFSDLEAELSSKTEQLSSAKATIRELETNLTTSKSSERAIRLQSQAFQSEATLACSDRDFYSKELERTREEWQSFRIESHQQTANLQNELDKLTYVNQSTTTNLTTLRSQHAELQKLYGDATERIKQLTDQSIESEAAFQKEIEAQKRVTMLMDKRDKQREERMEQLEKEFNQRRAELDQQERTINDALENERAHVAELEQKLMDTTNALSRLCASEIDENDSQDLLDIAANTPLVNRTPGTPLSRKQNGMFLANGISPAAAMASKLQKSGKSLTQVYTEKIVLEEELKKVQLENVRLSETMSQILGEIQDRAPLLHQQRVEHDRIENECINLTSQLTQVIEEKEEAQRMYQSCNLDLKALQRDYDLANSQVNDLSLQVRLLTVEVTRRETGNPFAITGDEEDLEKDLSTWRNAQVEEEEDVLLANDLITYRNITDMQQKNLKLLLFARTLTTKLNELEENRANKNEEEDEEDENTKQAIDEAHELILKLKTDLHSAQQKSEALFRERDMLRKMLDQSQAKIPGDHLSFEPDTATPDGSRQKLDELRTQFEVYRTEIGRDSKQMNEDLNQSRADLSRTQVLLAKANAQIEYLTERQRSLDQTNAMHVQEVQSLTASSAKLQDHISKGEMLLHQANENVTELKAKCHVLQHQVESLTSEREVWKGVEGRLVAENTSLTRERNNINDILRNMQVMQGEIERNAEDSRRRLETQLSKSEGQLSELKEKLKVEADLARQATLQRQIEGREYQSKIDKLTGEHLTARENLSAASATKTHLENQVTQLQKQLTMKEERLAVYEGHRRSDPGSNQTGNVNTSGSNDPSLTKEQRLEIELSELKIELVAAKEECTRAQQNVEQFKSISQSAEAALASLTATHDEYRSSQEAELERKQSALTSLEEHLRKVTEDLSAATSQNSELHRQLESQRADFEKEKLALNNKLVDLEEIETRVKARDNELRAEVNNQMKLAQDSHDRYKAEVQNHANSLNELKQVKSELETARESILEAQTTAQTATTKLTSSEASWSEQKTTLQKELANIQTRCDDLLKQNNLLHEHLETVSAQATKLSSHNIDQAVGSDPGDQKVLQNDMNENMVESVEQLRGVIRYLRNNYDIAQQQIELSKMESARLQQQLQHASKALDQTKMELNQERERSRQGYVSSAEHAQLLDQINTLNMIRESNITLRDEANRSERKAKQLEEQLKQTSETVEPLKQELRELQLTVQQYQQEIGILNEDNERWKLRNQQILEKYDRIDPAEVQGLRDEIERLKQELTQTREELSQLHHFKEKFYAIQGQARNIRQKSTEEKLALEAKLTTVNEELDKVKEVVRNLENDAKTSQNQNKVVVEQAAVQAQEQLQTLRQEKAAAESSLADALTFKNRAAETQASLDALKKELDQVKAAFEARESEITKLLTENTGAANTNKQLTEQLTKLREEASQNPPNMTSEATIEMEVSKRVQAKLATMSATEPGEISAGEEQVQQQINQVKQQALSEKAEAVQKAVEETTQRLTAEFAKSQAESAEKHKAELASSGSNPSTAVPEDLVEARVSSKVAEIKNELQAAAAAREQELIRKHQAELSEARKAPTQNPDLKQPTPEQLQEITKVAVEIAVKKKEAELLQLHKSSAEAMVETTKAKVMAEMNSKHNVVQMQLKRSHLKNAELTAKINELSAQLNGTSTTPPTSVVPATATPATPLAPTASTFVPTGTPDASSSQLAANTAHSAQTAPATIQSDQTGVTPNSADLANGAGLPTRPQGPTAQVIRGGAVRGRGGSTRGALPPVGLNTSGAASQAARGMARGTTITFGRGAPRGYGRGRAGMVGRGGAPGGGGVPAAAGMAPGPSGPITASSATSPQLPAEGRMAEKPGLTGSVSIRGAATIKKAGAGSLLGMAVKQATGTAAENASSVTPSFPSIAGQAANKRPREEDALGSSNGNQTSNDPAQLKRAKGINNPSSTQAEESSGSVNSTPVNELAARLSKRP
ncbi:hypothetical protein PGTUg99_032841 [Puccinia graminis f. sp. tritici]|uniref:Uncharacterized protein n=1 Tax=Puccinia graminis f. sp. tritici TaxID=56615 RepID=A0A5B0S9Z6_PUCGR|nr:hypothetical protein PGTUg99_032841 [Puccinia graminis f. sp. tritici]